VTSATLQASVVPADYLERGDRHSGTGTRAALGFSPEILTVSSDTAGEGKTTVCLGIAITIAQHFPIVGKQRRD
jgi:hypothetical protein